MKLATALLVLAGLVLAAIVLRAGEPSYEVRRVREMPERTPFALSGTPPAGHVVLSLDVEGMCCDGCSGKLHAAASALDEVVEVAVDPILGRAQVVVPAGFDVARLERALTFDKYVAHAPESSRRGDG